MGRLESQANIWSTGLLFLHLWFFKKITLSFIPLSILSESWSPISPPVTLPNSPKLPPGKYLIKVTYGLANI